MRNKMVKFIFASLILTFVTIFNYTRIKDVEVESNVIITDKTETKIGDQPQPDPNMKDPTLSKKLILLWNSFWDEPGWEVGFGDEPFKRLSCPVRDCFITDNRDLLNMSAAVLFHIHQLTETEPPPKSPDQHWVFFMLESPGWSQNLNYKSWRKMFNWTMTYRRDSDIRLHYGQVLPAERQKAAKKNSRLLGKPKGIAWIVSNCNTASGRAEYVRELQKYIPVDIYGKCGNLTCQKDWQGSDQACLQMISKTYKFYLAFENNFCKDYVTEKFFKTLPLDIVPIVRGGANYSQFAPHPWYINTKDFTSTRQLADYIKFLNRNPQEYLKYFDNRENYDARAYFGIRDLPSWCELCEKLNKKNVGKTWHTDITTWWSAQDCHKPTDLLYS